MRRVGIAAVVAALAASLGACDGDEPPPRSATAAPTPDPATTSTTPPPIPDPRQITVATLLRPGAGPDAVLYGEMNGVAPEEIVVLSSIPPEDPQLPPTPYLDAFAWDPGKREWVKVFDATDYQDGASGRGPLLAATDAVGQSVPFLQLVDFADDGTMELVAGVQTFGASAGPLELWILSWLSEAFSVEFYRATERGGHVSYGPRTVTLETGVYRPGDPGCCPSAFETLVIGWDTARTRIVVLERTEEEAPQS